MSWPFLWFAATYMSLVGLHAEEVASSTLLKGHVSARTIESEQVWPARVRKTPQVALFKGVVGLLLSDFERTGDLPGPYRPEGQAVFPLRTFTGPEPLFFVIAESPAVAEKPLRWTVHPYTLEAEGPTPRRVRGWIERHRDQITELGGIKATPTASNRSVWVVEGEGPPPIWKLSSHVETSGSSRLISRSQAVRSVNASHLFRMAFERTQGILPLSQTRWSFLPEERAVIPRDLEIAAMIERPAKGFVGSLSEMEAVSAYGLNVRMADGRYFLEHVLDSLSKSETSWESSGKIPQVLRNPKAKRELTWKHLILPAWEFFLYMTFIEGIPPTVHGQNLKYFFKPNSFRPEGIGYLDLSLFISRETRIANGLSTPLIRPAWVREEDFEFSRSDEAMSESIDYFDDYFLKYLFGVQFSDQDLDWFRSAQVTFLKAFVDHHNEDLGWLDTRSKEKFLASFMQRIQSHREVNPKTADSPLKAIEGEMHWLTQGVARPLEAPLAMSGQDNELLRRSTEQRFSALRKFVEDLRAKTGLWEQVIPPEILNRLLKRYQIPGPETWPEQYALYGAVDYMKDEGVNPDKDEDGGRYYVIEHQLDPIPAGPQYIDHLIRLYGRHPSKNSDPVELDSPVGALKAAVSKWLGKPDPVIVVIEYNKPKLLSWFGSESEAHNSWVLRTAETLRRKYGIYTITSDSLTSLGAWLDGCLDSCLTDGPSLVYPDGTLVKLQSKLGKLVLQVSGGAGNQELSVDFVWNHLYSGHVSDLLDFALKAIARAEPLSTYHPLLPLLSDKAFQAYLDDLVFLYLRERPLISMQPTHLFVDAHGKFERTRLDRVFGELSQWYIKPSFGFGGKDVLSGEGISSSPSKMVALREKILESPLGFVAQRRVHPPIREGRKLELRVFGGLLTPVGEAWSSATALGRLAPKSSDVTNVGSHRKGAFSNIALVGVSRTKSASVSVRAKPPASESLSRRPHEDPLEGISEGDPQELSARSEEPYPEDLLTDDWGESVYGDFFGERPDLTSAENRESTFHQISRATERTLPLHPVPLIVDRNDAEILRKASEQQARAILSFLRDYYSGNSNWSEVVPEGVMKYIRERVPIYRDYVDVNQFNFLNGIDVLRSPDGTFYVLESNILAAAGIFANEFSRRELIKVAPEWGKKHLRESDLSKIREHVAQVTGRAKPFIVAAQYAVDQAAMISDLAARTAQIQRFVAPFLRDFEMELLTVHPVDSVNAFLKANVGFSVFEDHSHADEKTNTERRLQVDEDGSVWLETRAPGSSYLLEPRKKVDGVLLNLIPRHAVDWARPLMKAALTGRVWVSHSHGIEVADNKLLQSYMPTLISHYLGEDPVASIPKTVRFFKPDGSLDEDRVREVFGDLSNWYLKESVAAGGGQGVFSGRALSAQFDKVLEIMEALRKNPFSYIASRRVGGSTTMKLGAEKNRFVDFRAFSLVQGIRGNSPPIITNLDYFYSRGIPSGQHLHNNSSQSNESSVQLGVEVKAGIGATDDGRIVLCKDILN